MSFATRLEGCYQTADVLAVRDKYRAQTWAMLIQECNNSGLTKREFCDTVKGAESSAIVCSIVETAKANGIDPYDYLFCVLSVLPYFGKSVSHDRLETLMPWSNEVQQRYGKETQTEAE